MTGLLEIRERLRNFYGRYEVYVTVGMKFLLGLVIFFLINSQLGYREQLNQPAAALLLSLVCAFMPINIMVAAACGLVLIHLSALSLEVCVIGLCLMLLLFFLYGMYAPKHGYTAILTPVLCFFRIPQVVPVSAGLLCRPSAYLSVVSGAMVFFYIDGVKSNIMNFTSGEEVEGTARFTAALKILTGNREMYLVITAFLITSLLVYIIRRQSMNFAWRVALFSGSLVQMVILLAGYVLLGMPEKIMWVLIGTAVSVIICMILEFFFYNLDYSRIERVQFEDDEYYYFVKAVPKVYLARKDKRVKRITPKKATISRRELAQELDIDRDLMH